jgi:hypothetical protein
VTTTVGVLMQELAALTRSKGISKKITIASTEATVREKAAA